jgi:Thiamine pyrophosphate enzyme, C-terminal TPP binding domain
MRFGFLAVLITASIAAQAQRLSSAGGSPEHHSDIEIPWHILKPMERPAPDLSKLSVPAGFRIQKFAENVGNARILAIGPNENVYVTRREEGDILMFRVGADGLAAGEPVRVASRSGLHGIAFSKGKVYLAAVHEIFKADVRADGTFGPLDMIIHDLPDAGQHNTRTVNIGPRDMMYISVGSTCNECSGPNPENVEHSALRPQMVVRALSDLIDCDAVISLDCGSNTFFAARHLRLREGQRLTSPGMLATMAPGLPFAIAAQFAYPNRQSVAAVSGGGFAMLMAELTTAVQHNLPVKIVVPKNNSLSEVRFEQQDLGYRSFGCDLGPIDFVGFAKACGAQGFRCATPAEVHPALTSALRSPKAAIVEAVVDPDEPPAKPEDMRA